MSSSCSICIWVKAPECGSWSDVWSPCKMRRAAKDGWCTRQMLLSSKLALCERTGGSVAVRWCMCVYVYYHGTWADASLNTSARAAPSFIIFKCHCCHCIPWCSTLSVANAKAQCLFFCSGHITEGFQTWQFNKSHMPEQVWLRYWWDKLPMSQ